MEFENGNRVKKFADDNSVKKQQQIKLVHVCVWCVFMSSPLNGLIGRSLLLVGNGKMNIEVIVMLMIKFNFYVQILMTPPIHPVNFILVPNTHGLSASESILISTDQRQVSLCLVRSIERILFRSA